MRSTTARTDGTLDVKGAATPNDSNDSDDDDDHS